MEQGLCHRGRCQAIPADLLAERILLPAAPLSRRFSVSPSSKVYKAAFALTAKLFPLRAISVEHDEDGAPRAVVTRSKNWC